MRDISKTVALGAYSAVIYNGGGSNHCKFADVNVFDKAKELSGKLAIHR